MPAPVPNSFFPIVDGPAPAVSIIMPTFNRASYLERAVASVLKQSFGDWELVIVDDGSQDGSLELLKPLVLREPRIRVLAQSHRGNALALNSGITASVGRYITFIDSDDEYLNRHIEIRFNYLEDDPTIALIHGSSQIVGDPYVVDYFDPSRRVHVDDCFHGPTFFGKRQVFFELGGFRPEPACPDTEFMLRAKERFKVRKVPDRTYRYFRDTPGSTTNQQLSAHQIRSECS